MKKAQCIVCKCGSTIAACLEPECYLEKDWMRDVRMYAKKGYAIEVRECGNIRMEKCTCVKAETLTIFP